MTWHTLVAVALVAAIVAAAGGVVLGWAIRDGRPHPHHAGARRMTHVLATGRAGIQFGEAP